MQQSVKKSVELTLPFLKYFPEEKQQKSLNDLIQKLHPAVTKNTQTDPNNKKGTKKWTGKNGEELTEPVYVSKTENIELTQIFPELTQELNNKNGLLLTIILSVLGDAYGLRSEFKDPATDIKLFQLFEQFKDDYFNPFNQSNGQFIVTGGSDDSDQAGFIILVLTNALKQGKSCLDSSDAINFIELLREWFEHGSPAFGHQHPSGIGNLTSVLCRKFQGINLDEMRTTNPKSVFLPAYETWCETIEKSNFKPAPNGAIMRAGPLGFVLGDLRSVFISALILAAGSHYDINAILVVLIFEGLVFCLRTNTTMTMTIDEIIQYVVDEAKKFATNELLREDNELGYPFDLRNTINEEDLRKYLEAKTLKEMELSSGSTIGYAYKCMGSAIWALKQASMEGITNDLSSFWKYIQAITFVGGDADTNARVAGFLLGAYFTRVNKGKVLDLTHNLFKVNQLFYQVYMAGVSPFFETINFN
jgi:ADP-ribosylglycohydrolase